MKKTLIITIIVLASIGFINVNHANASLNCKSITGWLWYLSPVTGAVSEASCWGVSIIADLVLPPDVPEDAGEISEVEAFAPNLPKIPGMADPTKGIPELISFVYGFALWIVGIAVFVQIVAGGAGWLLAMGKSSEIEKAKKKITNAILGLILLLSSYVILNTINPDLVENAFILPGIGGASPGLSEPVP
jgi:hypothetical protein